MGNEPRPTPDPPPVPPAGPMRLFLALALLLPLLVAGLLAWHSLGDADVWLHHRIGRDLLAGRGQPQNSDFTFASPEREWSNHETLFQLLVAPLGPDPASGAAAPVAGWNLLRLALGLLVIGTLALGAGRWRMLAPGREPLPGGAATWLGLPLLLGLLLLWPRLILRPELISYLLLILVVRTVERAHVEPGAGGGGPAARLREALDPRRPAGRLFWLTLVWAWSHGFAALVPVLWILGALLAPLQRRIEGRPGRGWPPPGLALVLVLLLGALAATPQGPTGLLQPLRALGQFGQDTVDLRRVIAELAPLLETRNALHWTLLAFRISLVWGALVVVLGWGRISLLRLLLFALAAWAAIASQRNLGFYAIAFCLLHEGWNWPGSRDRPGPRTVWQRASGRLPRFVRRWHPLPAALLVVLVAGGWTLQIVGDDFYLREGVSRRFGGGRTPAVAPLGGAARLAELGVERTVANLVAAAPALDFSSTRLFVDGRTEAHPAADWARYKRILRGGDAALQALADLRPGAVLLGGSGTAATGLTRTLLASDAWRLDRLDESGWLFLPGAGTDSLAAIRTAARLEERLLNGGSEPRDARYADLCLAQSWIWKHAGRPDRQETVLRRGLERRPDHPTLLHNLGNVLRERGDNAAALARYTRALAVNPRLAGTALNQGACLMALRRFAEAADSFRRCLAIDPEMFEAWVNLGLALQQSGRPAAAREAFERALELRPGDQRLRRFLRQRR